MEIGIGAAIAKGVTAVALKGFDAISDLFRTDEEKAKAKHDFEFAIEKERNETSLSIEREMTQRILAIQEVNKEEAKSDNIFKSGWRPFIGWMCGAMLGFYFLVTITCTTVVWVKQCLVSGVILQFPYDVSTLKDLLYGMLGLASLRTFEKTKGKN